MPLLPSAHLDTFTRDNLPPESEWPVFSFDLPRLRWPDAFNCAEWLLDRALEEIDARRPAIFFRNDTWSYAELAERTNRICRALVEDLGIVPGNRVLLRGVTTQTLFALWLAVIKVGAIAVCTMPLLRTRELREIVEKAQVRLAICEENLVGEIEPLMGHSVLERFVTYGGELVWMLGGSYELTRQQVAQALDALLRTKEMVVDRAGTRRLAPRVLAGARVKRTAAPGWPD